MNKAIETMMNEHRLIEQILSSLAAFAEELERGHLPPRDTVARYGTFFKEFADRWQQRSHECSLGQTRPGWTLQ